MNNVIWLASYPKSGNTWTRAFLSALLGTLDVNINGLGSITIASAALPFEFATGVRVSDLTEDEIECLRPAAHQFLADKRNDKYFLKVHDAYIYTRDNVPLFPSAATFGAIYLIRNPLDVAISWANHTGVSIQESINQLNDPKFCVSVRNPGGTISNQLRQKLFNWGAHVESWINAKEIRTHIVRYEDIKKNAVKEFTALVRFAELDKTEEDIISAEEQCRFEKLKKQEEESGFRERLKTSGKFFNRGTSGYWREELTEEQVASIISNNFAMMKKFGYIDENGNPV